MADAYHFVGNFIWNEHFWLPRNTSWADLERDETTFIPRPADLWFTLPLSIILFILRLFWERFVATPIGRAYNLREAPPPKPVPSVSLEKAYVEYRKRLPRDEGSLQSLSNESGFTKKQIERWWRRKRAVNKPCELQKFRETSWRFLFYVVAFWYGLYVLWDKPWFADTMHCWYGYPRQHVPDSIYWYYMVELGFYFSLVISLFMDVRRKDFVEMIVHHIATITLMVCSWGNNMVRIGSLVLCVHDAVDYLMEGAKLAKYMKYQRLCDALFLVFTIVWFATRLVLYPTRVVYSASVESIQAIGMWPGWYLVNGFLYTLQVLHVIWFYMIMRILYAYICSGQVERDERSDSEAADSPSEDEAGDKKNGLLPSDSITPTSNNNIKKQN